MGPQSAVVGHGVARKVEAIYILEGLEEEEERGEEEKRMEGGGRREERKREREKEEEEREEKRGRRVLEEAIKDTNVKLQFCKTVISRISTQCLRCKIPKVTQSYTMLHCKIS